MHQYILATSSESKMRVCNVVEKGKGRDGLNPKPVAILNQDEDRLAPSDCPCVRAIPNKSNWDYDNQG